MAVASEALHENLLLKIFNPVEQILELMFWV